MYQARFRKTQTACPKECPFRIGFEGEMYWSTARPMCDAQCSINVRSMNVFR
jgi:hypothetical protein